MLIIRDLFISPTVISVSLKVLTENKINFIILQIANHIFFILP
jgi:hypothetical protein